jgi:hypothetical protein
MYLCAHSISTTFLSTCWTEEDKARIQFIYSILLRIQNLLRKLEKQDTQHILVASTRSLRLNYLLRVWLTPALFYAVQTESSPFQVKKWSHNNRIEVQKWSHNKLDRPYQNPFQRDLIGESLKPVFHLRIFSREANFSFVFIQLVPHGFSWKTKNKGKIRFARKNSQVENRHNEALAFGQILRYF